jgi:hypothetical protein
VVSFTVQNVVVTVAVFSDRSRDGAIVIALARLEVVPSPLLIEIRSWPVLDENCGRDETGACWHGELCWGQIADSWTI